MTLPSLVLPTTEVARFISCWLIAMLWSWSWLQSTWDLWHSPVDWSLRVTVSSVLDVQLCLAAVPGCVEAGDSYALPIGHHPSESQPNYPLVLRPAMHSCTCRQAYIFTFIQAIGLDRMTASCRQA